MKLAIIALPLALSGCLSAADDAAPATSEVSSDITVADWTLTNNIDTAPFALRPFAGNICYLTGISGQLKGTAHGYPGDFPENDAEAIVTTKVINGTNMWVAGVRTGTGTGVMAHVGCVPLSSANLQSLAVFDDVADDTVTMSGTSQCFLTDVMNTGGLESPVPGGGTPLIQLTAVHTGSNLRWTLHEAVDISGGINDFASSEAVCFDVPGRTYRGASSLNPPVTGSHSDDVHDDQTGATMSPTTACGLTMIWGNWVWSTPSSLSDGLYLEIHGLAHWRFTASASRGGQVQCLR